MPLMQLEAGGNYSRLPAGDSLGKCNAGLESSRVVFPAAPRPGSTASGQSAKIRLVSAYSSWGRLPNCHKLAAITWWTAENQGTLTCCCHSALAQMLQRTSWLCQVLGQLAKWGRGRAPSSPQIQPVRPGGWGEEGHQTRYHPCSASSHCLCRC